MPRYPEPIQTQLRRLAEAAYEKELRRALQPLDAAFAARRAGRLGSGALAYRIQRFQEGPARTLFERYNRNRDDRTVAYAVTHGILTETSIPDEVWAHLEPLIAAHLDPETKHNRYGRVL